MPGNKKSADNSRGCKARGSGKRKNPVCDEPPQKKRKRNSAKAKKVDPDEEWKIHSANIVCILIFVCDCLFEYCTEFVFICFCLNVR